MIQRQRFLPVLIILAGLLPSAWLLYKYHATPHIGFIGDDVMYIGAARSLADHSGYREAALPGSPWQTKYPPGYPLLLAGVLKSGLDPQEFWLTAHSWLWLIAASFALAWAMLQAGLTRMQSALVAALWTANPAAAWVGTSVLAEPPYCTLLFLALGLAFRSSGKALRYAVMAGALLGAATLIRSAGVVATGGVLLWFLWRKEYKASVCFALCAGIPAAIWMLWSGAHLPSSHDPVTSFYLDYATRETQMIRAAGLAMVLTTNAAHTVKSIGDLLVVSSSLSLARGVFDLAMVAFVVAALAEWKGGAFTTVALATMAFHLVWGPPNARYLIAAAPALLAAAVVKLSAQRLAVRIALLAVVVIADLYGTAELNQLYSEEAGMTAALAPANAFIQSQLPFGAVIVGLEQVWLRSGKQTVGLPRPMEYFYAPQLDSTRFFQTYPEVARQFGAGYLLLTPWAEGGERFIAAVRSDPALDRVFASQGFEIFKFKPDAASGPASR